MYHRTNSTFTVFDTSKSGSNQGKTHGDGIYLSTSRKVGISIGKNDGIATVYNVGKIKKDKLPSVKLMTVVGSKPLGNSSSNVSIPTSAEIVNGKNKGI